MSILNSEEAWLICDREEDLLVKQFLEGILTAVCLFGLRNYSPPATSFDAEFMVRTTKRFFEDKRIIEGIMAGHKVHLFRIEETR